MIKAAVAHALLQPTNYMNLFNAKQSTIILSPLQTSNKTSDHINLHLLTEDTHKLADLLLEQHLLLAQLLRLMVVVGYQTLVFPVSCSPTIKRLSIASASSCDLAVPKISCG